MKILLLIRLILTRRLNFMLIILPGFTEKVTRCLLSAVFFLIMKVRGEDWGS